MRQPHKLNSADTGSVDADHGGVGNGGLSKSSSSSHGKPAFLPDKPSVLPTTTAIRKKLPSKAAPFSRNSSPFDSNGNVTVSSTTVAKVGCFLLVVFSWLILLVGYAAYSSLSTFTEKTGLSPFIPFLLLVGRGGSAVGRPRDLQQQQQQQMMYGHSNSIIQDGPIHAARREFLELFGPDAPDMFHRGVQQFGSLQNTATRILRASASELPLVLSFAGYSVTVGRGNRFEHSYPFILEQILKPVFRNAMNLEIKVKNAAIGGIPSFPYGFCFEHFLGADADVVSWDYSMNEGKGAAALEAYLRQSQNQLGHHPMMIVLDTNPERCQLLKEYADRGWLQDGICVGMAKDAVPNLQELVARQRQPMGFQNWDEFGAPPSCPGRSSWHPKKREHEFLGWMVAMYFVEALAVAQTISVKDPNWRKTYAVKNRKYWKSGGMEFAAPLHAMPSDNSPAVNRLLYGDPVRSSQFKMKTVSCRTNFLPATDNDKILPSIVVSGLAPQGSDNIMNPRTDEAYAAGWVMDVSAVERETKDKVEKCGGLGYVDWKMALYGIPESGTLRLWLPVEGFFGDDNVNTEVLASDWFDGLVICEANEKRQVGACHLDSDLVYLVDDKKVESPQMVSGVGEYLKRKTCVSLEIPKEARLVQLKDVRPLSDQTQLSDIDKARLSRNGKLVDNHVGLIVDMWANKNVNRHLGACCVSHVVWSQQ